VKRRKLIAFSVVGKANKLLISLGNYPLAIT
jgi:hypothetical protein